MVAVSWVGPPAGEVDGQRAVHPGQPVGQPGQTVAPGQRGAADAVVGHVTTATPPTVLHLDRCAARRRLCFSMLVSASATTKYAAFWAASDSLTSSTSTEVRHDPAGGQRGDGRAQPLLGQDRRGDPAGQRADLGQRVLGLLQRLVQQPPGLARVGVEPALGGGDVHAEPDQPLLRAVVQVPLQPAQRVRLGLAGRGPALGQLAHLLRAGRSVSSTSSPGAIARVQPDQPVQDGRRGQQQEHAERRC